MMTHSLSLQMRLITTLDSLDHSVSYQRGGDKYRCLTPSTAIPFPKMQTAARRPDFQRDSSLMWLLRVRPSQGWGSHSPLSASGAQGPENTDSSAVELTGISGVILSALLNHAWLFHDNQIIFTKSSQTFYSHVFHIFSGSLKTFPPCREMFCI